MNPRILANSAFVAELGKYSLDELLRMHDFYIKEKNNQQAQDFAVLALREYTNRVCAKIDKIIATNRLAELKGGLV